MDELATLLVASKGAVERYIKFRISDPFDAEDVLQETYMAASRGFPALKDREILSLCYYEGLSEAEITDRLTVNGRTYVHRYDCITDYIL